MSQDSIFKKYYSVHKLIDRAIDYSGDTVTVIIPTVHSNELWEVNLHSIYKEIPVAKLLIGDGGCIDDTVEIVKKFPRVDVHDHSNYKSLGYSIRKLIEAVETEWFIYLHSDVYLPPGWFDKMLPQCEYYDWFGCRMRQTVMIEFDNDYCDRPYAGSQFGKKLAFSEGLKRIDDDYVYRQEDFVFSAIVEEQGYKEGKIDDVFHYHQTIDKSSAFWNPQDVKVNITKKLNREQEIRYLETQFKGIVKYLKPSNDWQIDEASICAHRLIELKYYTSKEIYSWVSEENNAWLVTLKKHVFKLQIRSILYSMFNRLRKILF